jgi:hypothetical protein
MLSEGPWLQTEFQLLLMGGGVSHTFRPSRQMLNMFVWLSARRRLLLEKLIPANRDEIPQHLWNLKANI